MNREARAVYFCSSVGGGVFGAAQIAVWRRSGINAIADYSVGLEEYWGGKERRWSHWQLRWMMYIRYPLGLWWRSRQANYDDIFIAATNPFFLPAMVARGTRGSGVRVVQLVFDLYPEAMIYGGGFSRGHPLVRFAERTTRSANGRCSATVYLGKRIKVYAEATYGASKRSVVIPVGTDVEPFRGQNPMDRGRANVRILYSGHMGRLHDPDTIVHALGKGIPNGLDIEFAASGSGVERLRRCLVPLALAEPERFRVTNTRESGEWVEALLAADIAIVTMRKGAEKVVVPSKTYSAMAAGQAVLAICPRDSDLADLIIAHDCGWVIEPGNVTELQTLLSALPHMREEILKKRTRAYLVAHEQYSMEVVGREWMKLLESLDERF